MQNKLRTIMLIILIAVAYGAAGQGYEIDRVCVGSERHYRIDGETGSIYAWLLTDPFSVVTTLPETGDTVTIIWNVPEGIYTLTNIQYSQNGCDTLQLGHIEVFSQPYAFAGENLILCTPGPVSLTNAFASDYSSILWSTGGDGNFDDNTAINPTYTLGPNDITNGSAILTLTANGLGNNGSCPPAVSVITITISSLLADITVMPVSCNGTPDGSVTFVASGGTEPYTYTLDGNASFTGEFTGLAAGTYTYLISDASGCELAGEVIVTSPDQIAATLVQTDINCAGAANGVIEITEISGGSGSFEFRINGGLWQSDAIFTDLTPGDYLVEVRDVNAPDCIVETGSITITEPEILSATVAWTDETYNGSGDGTITISAPAGGSGDYEYSIDGINWLASGNFTGLVPGSYEVFIRDANATDCFISLMIVEIMPGTLLTADVDSTNVTCFGGSDGTITISNPQYGSGIYEYSIDGGLSWQDNGNFTGLFTGLYIVMIRDANIPSNEILLTTVTITEPEKMDAVVNWTNETIPGANDGTITVSSPSGGSGVYEYSIDGVNWQAFGDFTSLVPGSYGITIRDANAIDCYIFITTIEILQGGMLTATVNFTNVTCFGENNGSITVTNPIGGSGNYEYSIDNGTTWQSSGIFTGLYAGTYGVVIRDADIPSNTVTLANIIISEPGMLIATVTFTNETSPGANDGTITVSTPSGGSGTYEYSIDGINWQIPGIFTGLTPGGYTVFMRDATVPDCVVTLIIIEILPNGALSAVVSSTNITCFGSSDGTITITDAVGGSGDFEFSINGGTSWQTNGNYTGLSSGSYPVMMRDANDPANAVTLATIIITQPDELNAAVTFTNETLPGANDGTITVSAPTGGSGNYEYSINGFIWQSSGVFTGLVPGFYQVYMRDADAPDCYVNLILLQILPGGMLSAEVGSTNVTCFGGNDGTISITNPAGGSGNYNYSIDGGTSWQNNGSYNALFAGSYVVMLRDANDPANAVILATVIISEPSMLAATVNFTNETFPGANDGTITISAPSGGSGVYEYSINGVIWQATGIFTGLTPGLYAVYIRDANATGCYILLQTIEIMPAGTLSAVVESTNINCFGAGNGTITITNPVGGSGSYQYSIDGGMSWQNSGVYSGLTAGIYVVMIRDANEPANEVTLTTLTISEPAVLTAMVTWSDETFPGANDGTIDVSAPSGGSGAYEYSIDGVSWQASGSFAGLAPGFYPAYIRDANATGCDILLQIIEILPGSSLTGEVSSTSVTCYGGNEGSISIINPSGGSGSYEYSIDGGTTWHADGNFTGLSAASYPVMLRDAVEPANATTLMIVEITGPDLLSATVSATPTSCPGNEDGDIVFSGASGGSGNHEFSIDGGNTWQAGEEFLNLATGTYQAWMRDADYPHCSVYLGEVIVTEPPVIIATAEAIAATCNLANGTITITATGGTGEHEFMLTGITGWQSENLFIGLEAGTYPAMVRDAEGCEISIPGISVENIAGPAITNIEINNAINSQPNGNATIIAGSPALPLQYSLTGNGTDLQLSPFFDNLAVGNYTAYVTDANGCIVSEEFMILNTVEGEVEISANMVSYCLNLPVIVPVEAKDFNNISSFIIELVFDPTVISFNGLTNINGALENGTFSTSIIGNTLQIRYSIWNGSASVAGGQELFSLVFNSLVAGNSGLTWNWLQCVIYSPSNDSIPAIYVNGLAEILPSPAVYAKGTGEYCEGDTLTLQAGSLDGQILDYEWTGPTGYKHHSPDWQLGQLSMNDNGDFRLLAVNPELCSASQLVSVKVNPKPIINISYADTLCFGQQILLDPGSGFASYLWQDGSTAQNQLAYEEGIYWVQVIDNNNCRAIDSVQLIPCNIEMLIPNAFTPNGDGLNDTFKPIVRGWEPSSYLMQIYTKWGQLIFETNNYTEGWDGTANGVPVMPNTFVYVISYEAPSYVTRTMPSPVTGVVTVVR